MSADVGTRSPLSAGAFLMAARARLRPAEVGLPDLGRRRVAGLRREEVARLAGVSGGYYRRIERDAAPDASDAVVQAVAGALRLDAAEKEYLLHCIRRRRARPPALDDAPTRPAVASGVLRVLEGIPDQPMLVVGPRLDVLAHNALADELYGGLLGLAPARRNFAWLVFAEPAAVDLLPDWDITAADTAGMLRLHAARYPGDAATARLVGALRGRSETFTRLWDEQVVRDRVRGQKAHRNGAVGDLVLTYETFDVRGAVGQRLCVHTPDPGSRSARRLAELAAKVQESRR